MVTMFGGAILLTIIGTQLGLSIITAYYGGLVASAIILIGVHLTKQYLQQH
jgi:hypothetical protein